MKIALDFDGVLSDTMASWVDQCNRLLGTKYTPRSIEQWHFFVNMGITSEKAFEIFDLAWGNPLRLRPMEPNLDQKTKMLQNLGELDIVSAVPEKHYANIECWLNLHDIKYNELILTQNKCELDYDVFIDDSPSNAEKLQELGKNLLLLNQPWNRDLPNYSRRHRVYNLYHAIDEIRRWLQ